MDVLDCITCDPIPADRHIVVKEGDNTYDFDVMTLYKNFLTTQQLINPFTKQPLSSSIDRQVRIFGEAQKTIVSWKHETISGSYSIHVDSFLTVGDLFLEVLRNTASPVNAKTFETLDG